MPFHQPDSLRYFTFDLLADRRLTHAIFTRRGGVSPTPWAALNVGGTVGDDPERVKENRQRAFQSCGRALDSLYDAWQVHSRHVVYVDAPRSPQAPYLQADILLTDHPQVTLMMRFADCVPILLYDPRQQVIGLVHAGWLGTVRKAAYWAVHEMQEHYGCNPCDIQAGIGPSIAAHHYPVGAEVVEQVRLTFREEAAGLLSTNMSDYITLDLWEANRFLLEQAGVRNIEVSGLCTACQLQDWYSHRAELGRTGRFGVLIGLNSDVKAR